MPYKIYKIYKYPRTHHIVGSRLQPGDEDLEQIPFSSIAGRYLVIEEKVDGANAAISFTSSRELLLQSRGHYLTGGYRERHFNLFKQWAKTFKEDLWQILGDRFVLYGEWLYAKHTIFYNNLPHYFLEFDIFDKKTGHFLSTEKRWKMLKGSPVVSVRVLYKGTLDNVNELKALIGPSAFISGNHIEALRQRALELSLDAEQAVKETDPTNLMEGLYIKVEKDDIVKGRYKFVRASFFTKVLETKSHWLSKPIIPNMLVSGCDLYNYGKR